MDIIAQNGRDVNIYIGTGPAVPGWMGSLQAKKTAEKWAEKKAASKRMAAKMKKIGEYRRASRIETCAEYITGEYCPECNRVHVSRTQLCRDRVCPLCAWRLSMKRYANMVSIMDALRNAYPGAAWQFVTLTAKNCTPEALSATIDEMARAWNSIASRKTFKRRIAGWARALEITYNADRKTLHPHFHMLVMWQEGLEPDPDFVIDAWMGCTALTTARAAQDSQLIHAKEETWHESEDDAVTAAVLETYKYTAKSSELEEMPLRVFRATVDGLKGRRLVAFGGKVKEYAAILGADDMENPDENEAQEHMARCINCEAVVKRVSAEWAGNGYIWRREA